MENILIKLNKVKKNYKVGEVKIEALKEVSLDIYTGELIVVLGTSGSGKSTLLNLIGGMDKPTKGEIMFNNINLSKASEKVLSMYRREDVGFIFQFYNLIPDLTAGENISLAAGLAKEPLKVEEVLKEVGLIEKKNVFPSQLSGGEQQRISIARALVKKPMLLLCDEPTGALDYDTGKMVLALLENIQKNSNSTIIIVTHNSAIAEMANRVIKMRSGEIIDIIENKEPISVEGIEW